MLKSQDASTSNDESTSNQSIDLSNKYGNLKAKKNNTKKREVPIDGTVITFSSKGISSQSFAVNSGQLVSVSSSKIDNAHVQHHHHLRIVDDTVSNNHASILFNEGVVLIKDNASEFGTHVNGKTLLCENKEYSDWLVLDNDDVIIFGNISFTVTINAEKSLSNQIFLRFKVADNNQEEDFPVRELMLTNYFDMKNIVYTHVGRGDKKGLRKPSSTNMIFKNIRLGFTYGYIYAYNNEINYCQLNERNISTFYNDIRVDGRQTVALAEGGRLEFDEPNVGSNRLCLTVDCIRKSNVSDDCDQENMQPTNKQKQGNQIESSKNYSSFSIEQLISTESPAKKPHVTSHQLHNVPRNHNESSLSTAINLKKWKKH